MRFSGSGLSLRRLYLGSWLRALGLRPYPTRRPIQAVAEVIDEFQRFRAMQAATGDDMPLELSFPCLSDRDAPGGTARGHYFHQDLLVAQRIFELRPSRHVDVGSRVDGFVAHVAAFREIDVIDVRPTHEQIRNIRFLRGDITQLAPELWSSCDSVSCLHALEHVGLGRYGDPLDPLGSEKALAGLAQLLQPGGTLHLSVPIGRECIAFNAHRIFSFQRIERMLAAEFDVVRFAWVDDAGALHREPELAAIPRRDLDQQAFGLGIFELVKRQSIARA